MRTILSLLIIASAAFGDDLLIGYRQRQLNYEGPGEWKQSVDPIWVYEYHTLRLRYRASGLTQPDAPILTLRPGSIGPVTPGATNPENPFVAGTPVAVVKAGDLLADGAVHTLEIELLGKMRTARIDQLQFTLPAGSQLSIDDLQFIGGQEVFPCGTDGPALPENATKLASRASAACSGSPATSLRGRETIQIDGGGRNGGTLYLSLMAHFAGVSSWRSDHRPGRLRIQESSETSDVIARLQYDDGPEEHQFPTLISERRHALLNLKPALYALALDPARRIRSVELIDRSPHAQLVLFAAGVSSDRLPPAVDELALPARRAAPPRGAEASFENSKWYRMTAAAGTVKADFRASPKSGKRALSLTLTNVSKEPQKFKVSFPSVTVRPTEDAKDAYYVFPRQGAVIGNAEQALSASYSGLFPLQFVDVFAPAANRGACVIVKDTGGRAKQFALEKVGPRIKVEVEYTVQLAPGESSRLPDVQIVPHGGDWHEGFAAYREWLATWYKPAGPRPAWLRSAFWARRDYPVGGTGKLFDVRRNRYTFEEFIRDGGAFGGIDFIDISGWAMSEKSGRVGDYPIELGGAADLRRNVALAREKGIPTGLYFEGYLIDKDSAIGRKSGGGWQIMDDKGQGRWWAGNQEFFTCPYAPGWDEYLSGRTAAVAREVGAGAIYLDEYGFGRQRCYATTHGHAPGVETLPGELAMTRRVRRALDAAGMNDTILYIEETPPDAAAPYYDAAFCYNFAYADRRTSPLKLNLWRFAFPDIRLWDMVSLGVDPRQLSSEDVRLSLWHGNGLWLKGHSDTWYGEDLLAFIRRAHGLLKEHAAAFAGTADALIDSPHPAVFINRFRGTQATVYTLFNASYRTVRFRFQGRERALGPRAVDVIGGSL